MPNVCPSSPLSSYLFDPLGLNEKKAFSKCLFCTCLHIVSLWLFYCMKMFRSTCSGSAHICKPLSWTWMISSTILPVRTDDTADKECKQPQDEWIYLGSFKYVKLFWVFWVFLWPLGSFFNTSDTGMLSLQLLLHATGYLNKPRTENWLYNWFSVIKEHYDSVLHKTVVV